MSWLRLLKDSMVSLDLMKLMQESDGLLPQACSRTVTFSKSNFMEDKVQSSRIFGSAVIGGGWTDGRMCSVFSPMLCVRSPLIRRYCDRSKEASRVESSPWMLISGTVEKYLKYVCYVIFDIFRKYKTSARKPES